jgi:hypothetical protein
MVGSHVLDLKTHRMGFVIDRPSDNEIVLEMSRPAKGGGIHLSKVTRHYWEVSIIPSMRRNKIRNR